MGTANLDLTTLIALRDAAQTAYQNALNARSESVGDTQLVHQDIAKLADELNRWQQLINQAQAQSAGVSNWTVRTAKWAS
jgi:precorrin isomerase